MTGPEKCVGDMATGFVCPWLAEAGFVGWAWG